jgi:hypothetical protein
VRVGVSAARPPADRLATSPVQVIHHRFTDAVEIAYLMDVRFLAYLWSLPTTFLGLCFLVPALITGGGVQVVDGVIEIHGGLVRWFLTRCTLLAGGASAMTLGQVVLGRDVEALEWTRPHERIHVRQCERWGPLFIPAYLLASLYLKLFRRDLDAYRDNPFEREAYERE